MRHKHLKLTTATWQYAKIEDQPSSPSEQAPPHPPDLSARLACANDFRPCTQFPSQIHAELLKAGGPDPFLGRNEERVQWIGERDWIYRCSFEWNGSSMKEQSDLCFDGLDTFATIYLNESRILQTDNMFQSHRVNVTELLQAKNTLHIVFESAARRGRQLEAQHLGPGNHWPAWNGDPSRLFVRKAGFNYGWDWGPVIMTAGPWRPVWIETYTARIYDFWPRATVDADLKTLIRVHWQVADASPMHAVTLTFLKPCGATLLKKSFAPDEVNLCSHGFDDGEVELWWPTGMGRQPLYSIKVELVDTRSGVILDTVKRKVGFRRIEVVQAPLVDAPGMSFCFRVNNVPFFVGGSNWIPIDSVLTNATPDRYRKWLELLVESNQQMIRVWGGGTYEHDTFYDLCDELGILVWQDFMFACGAYPAYPEFIASVKQEAIDNITRLRSHPCLALFAGNNEDYQVAEAEKLEYDPDDHEGDWSKTNFPARELYERVLPALVRELSDAVYWPASPYGGKTTRDPTIGDLHQWDVWHGVQAPYQDYPVLSGRFVSEFGMQAAPHPQTIEYFLNGDQQEAYPQSRTMDAHNKAAGHERRLAGYIAENIRLDNTLPGYIYATQFIQAEALATAFSGWRRLFRGGVDKAYCAGALVWQLNDVWPCTSWSIVDYFLRPKPAYFAIKRALAPIALGSKRYTKNANRDRSSDTCSSGETFVDVWVSTSTLDQAQLEQEFKLVVESFEFGTGRRVLQEMEMVKLGHNRSQELRKIRISEDVREGETVRTLLLARLFDSEGRLVSRTIAWPEPFKYLDFARTERDLQLSIEVSPLKGVVTLEASDHPVKGFVLSTNDDQVKLSDNFIDLAPRDRVQFKVMGATKETKFTWSCYYGLSGRV
ncbi:beta-mannosidase [Sporobolomyces koalae]|uniref:beta-mannosidase n=1 Tax=Sporobolomyces koalae TaxID=500713 RepID=UPI0031717A5E